ncbi:MAG: DUF177 domain-containing protein [Ruminococcaceae bacterium]|nr:DUF177 domain-containing protein [Oscillospiraceae bacterium]
MKLDLRKLLAGEVDKIDIDYSLESSDLPSFDDVSFADNVNVSGTLKNNGGYMKLSLLSSLDYTSVCARCLKEIKDNLNINFEKTVCEEGDLQNEDNDDYVEITDGMLDVDEALIEDIILNFPSKILCDENCKGLCPKCGKDLNCDSCSCVTKEIDPRLAPLLKIFDNDDSQA